MSTPTILFFVYLMIGMLSLVIAVASPGKERRVEKFEKRFGPFGGTELDLGLGLLVVLLWPIWLLSLFAKEEPPTK